MSTTRQERLIRRETRLYLQLAFSENDTPAIHIVGADLDGNAVAGNDADPVLAHLAGKAAKHRVIHFVDLNAKRAANFLGYDPIELDRIFLSFLFFVSHNYSFVGRLGSR